MPIVITIIISATGFVSTICGLILTFRSIKATSPGEAQKKWQKGVDAKLDNDNRRITHLERSLERTEELNRLLLRSVKGVLDHLATGNHTSQMNALIKNIDEFLIGK
jgi:hypothetical protein